ncbi:MAG TPA: hypothetical protein VKB34_01250 [Povalibacter sp.]|nr:hypothetical protein [Povalibacter sp.]
MKVKRWSAVFGAIAWACNPAHSFPSELTLIPHTHGQVVLPQQGGTSSLIFGLEVEAATFWSSLTVGGGYTIECEGTALSIPAQNDEHIYDFWGGVRLKTKVPKNNTPTLYDVPGWETLGAGSCRQCTFKYRGRAADGLGAIAVGPTGVNFSLNLSPDRTQADTLVFNVCKGLPASSGGGCDGTD